MRRSIVFPLLLTAAAAAAIWVLAVASPAGAAARSPHIACPQRANVIPCCPLPVSAPKSDAQSICCPPTTCCPTPTSGTCCTSGACCQPYCNSAVPTITSSPWPSKAGQKVVIRGAAPSGASVVLWRELPNQSSFHQIATTTADSSGKYAFTRGRGTVMTDQKWYVTSNGAQSVTLSQEVDARVGFTSSTRSTVVGRAIVLRGHVKPSHAGQRVLIQMSRGGSWRVIARPRLGRGSGYKVTRRFAKPGRVKLRVVFQRDSRNERSTSKTLTLKILS